MPENDNQIVVLPADDFRELQATAHQNLTLGERAASTAQTSLVFGAIAGAFVAASWGFARAVDWRDRRKHEREDESWNLRHDSKSTAQ